MIGTWLGIYTPQPEQVTPAPQGEVRFGAVNFVGTLPTTLSGSGITSSATSIGVVSMTLRQTGQALSMSDFGTIGYITLEPGVSSRQEFASFTGITRTRMGLLSLLVSLVDLLRCHHTLLLQHSGSLIVEGQNSSCQTLLRSTTHLRISRTLLQSQGSTLLPLLQFLRWQRIPQAHSSWLMARQLLRLSNMSIL